MNVGGSILKFNQYTIWSYYHLKLNAGALKTKDLFFSGGNPNQNK